MAHYIQRKDSGEMLADYCEGYSTARVWTTDTRRAHAFASEAEALEVMRAEGLPLEPATLSPYSVLACGVVCEPDPPTAAELAADDAAFYGDSQ